MEVVGGILIGIGATTVVYALILLRLRRKLDAIYTKLLSDCLKLKTDRVTERKLVPPKGGSAMSPPTHHLTLRLAREDCK